MITCASFVFYCVFCDLTSGHMYMSYPLPRSTNSGIKSGPCGSQTNDFTSYSITTIQPGILTIVIQETVFHSGAPFRIALSHVESDIYDCVLLDHIPQHTVYGFVCFCFCFYFCCFFAFIFYFVQCGNYCAFSQNKKQTHKKKKHCFFCLFFIFFFSLKNQQT